MNSLNMVEIIEMLAPFNSECRSGYRRNGMLGITIHETGNTSSGSGALAHAIYLQNSGQYEAVSWHYAVDDSFITHSIPENEIAWHSGDGRNGKGNSETIAIEICVNPDSRFKQAKSNAAQLAANILYRHGFKKADGALFRHKDWSGANCPAQIISSGSWSDFKTMVQKNMDGLLLENSAHAPNFNVYIDLTGHLTANDAIKGVNAKTTVKSGKYYVYKEAEGAVNVTKTYDVPGSWIDPVKNTIAKSGGIKVGDTVKILSSADIYSRSSIKIPSMYKNKSYTIQQVGEDDILIKELYSWVKKTDAEISSSSAIVFNIGDAVKILSSADIYSRSTTKIPSMYKNKPYTIQQVGGDDVLLKELYSWVKKVDVDK